MDPVANARREVGLEIERLAAEFERSDAAAFRRTRIVAWAVTAAVTLLVLVLLLAGGDARYLGVFWVALVGLTWAGHALSRRRQRQQTAQLRALATRWLAGGPPTVG
jgi:hypothetical protein